jgi:hypothetical protein
MERVFYICALYSGFYCTLSDRADLHYVTVYSLNEMNITQHMDTRPSHTTAEKQLTETSGRVLESIGGRW